MKHLPSWASNLAVLLLAAFAAARTRTSRTEKRLRRVLNMPARHPERVYGGGRAAERGDFPAWLAELEQDGIDAGRIIRDFRSTP